MFVRLWRSRRDGDRQKKTKSPLQFVPRCWVALMERLQGDRCGPEDRKRRAAAPVETGEWKLHLFLLSKCLYAHVSGEKYVIMDWLLALTHLLRRATKSRQELEKKQTWQTEVVWGDLSLTDQAGRHESLWIWKLRLKQMLTDAPNAHFCC